MTWNRYSNSKYGNVKATIGGTRKYHSTLEKNDALWLMTLERDGEITDLKEQVRYRCFHNGIHLWDSIVDFQFIHKGVTVWYETKGFPTPEYKLKRKFIEADLKEGPDVYIVNAKDLMEYMRGRTKSL